jgi:hypothetical protein
LGTYPQKKEKGIFSFEIKEKMPGKGLEKGDGGWGRGKEPFLEKVFPSSPIPIINLYWA